MDFSRRSFLKGAGAFAAGSAVAGLAGCAPTVPPATDPVPGVSGPAPAPVTELLASAYINPQDFDYRQNTTDFKALFSPFKIGNVELNHRMIKSAAGSACYLNGLTEELMEYYVRMAKGGVEFIWVEMISELAPNGKEPSDEARAFGKKLVEECAKYGTKLGYQSYAFSPRPANDMTPEEISAFQDTIVQSYATVASYGFVAAEINAAGFNLGESFLSRTQNKRTDQYGFDTLENRSRYVVELIQKTKKACGDDFIVQVLINAIAANDAAAGDDAKVTTMEEGIEFAKIFEAAGADAMHLRLGPLSYHPCQFASDLYFLLNGIEGATTFGTQWDFNKHWQGKLIANHSGAGMLIDVVAEYKKHVKIPCGTVTYMDPAHAPDFFEAAIADGKVDFYIMNRPLTVDMEYVNKLREGRLDEIAPCTRCLHCHIGGNGDNAARGYCRVNAMTQRVYRKNGPAGYDLPPIDKAKKVMVIGGGPAGMEAARIAAERGHSVTLYEKKGALGGLLDFAEMVKGKHENLGDLKAYLARQQELKGVKVVLNKEVDAAFIDAEAPDAVILAAGGLRDTLNVSGDGSVPVIAFEDFMATEMGEDVIVYGSNAQAIDCALWLIVHKKHVTIVTPSDYAEIDKQQSEHAKEFIMPALYTRGLRVWPKAKIKAANGKQVTIETEVGLTTIVECDAIVNAADMLPNTGLVASTKVASVFTVGDCANPFNIARAIHAGNDAGRAV